MGFRGWAAQWGVTGVTRFCTNLILVPVVTSLAKSPVTVGSLSVLANFLPDPVFHLARGVTFNGRTDRFNQQHSRRVSKWDRLKYETNGYSPTNSVTRIYGGLGPSSFRCRLIVIRSWNVVSGLRDGF